MLVRDAARDVYANVSRHAQIILEQSDRMKKLADGLMGASHAELKVERVDVNGLIQRSIEFVRSQNRFDGVDWEVRFAEPAPQLRADPQQLEQVLLNLFMNAADAMGENANGGRKVISVASEFLDGGKSVRVVVADTGPGIPTANLARIFEPRYTTKAHGHGFGLSTSYRIVTNHGGRIAAESPPGQGARFLVTIPVHGPGGWH
jgi:signal transduction histidine kinase